MTQSAAAVKPAYFTAPFYRETLGPEVADLAALAGFPPDPEQAIALDAMFAIDNRGKAAAFEFAVICPRQNLKTGLLKMAALGWLFVTDQKLIVWSAHEMRTTREAFRDITNLIVNCPHLRRRLALGASNGIMSGNGNESIELAPTAECPEGQRILFKARTNGGGRGLTGDKVILDEAFALNPSHMGSLLPTLSRPSRSTGCVCLVSRAIRVRCAARHPRSRTPRRRSIPGIHGVLRPRGHLRRRKLFALSRRRRVRTGQPRLCPHGQPSYWPPHQPGTHPG